VQDRRSHLVVVGSGGRPYREYAFASLASRYRVSAVLPVEPTWQRPYLDSWRVAELGEADAVAAAVAELTGPESGLMTWDETVLEVTAEAAEKLSLPHMSARAAARCRDKLRTRELLDDAGLPAVRYGLAHSADEAERLAASLGLPVVVKPRALAGSVGVALARDPEAVRGAFELAAGAAFGTLPTGHGVLVEEFLEGPEISVDSVVRGRDVACVHVARKRLGFAPHFEEVGHLVDDWTGEPWADEVRALVTAAHHALGVELGVTHAEIRLTTAGPRLVELNGRLGGDLIPLAGRLSTGIDLVVAAAELALGRAPELTPLHRRACEVRFAYPPHDGTVRALALADAAAVAGIEHAGALAEPGTVLLLPPRQAIPRLAVLMAVGEDEAACARILDQATPKVAGDVAPLVMEGHGAT
jgi:biotin carboxylase